MDPGQDFEFSVEYAESEEAVAYPREKKNH